MQHHIAQYAVLVEFVFRQTKCEPRSVNRHIEFFQNVGQRAEMIFVAVRQDDRRDLVAKLFEDFEIGNGNIDAIDALFGKAHARVDNDHLVAKTQQRAVHPKLADTAEGNDFQDVTHLPLLLNSLQVKIEEAV